jgi:hypothetical protein
VATPNYGYEKRQRELAKKKKKEEKLRAKAERKSGEGGALTGEAQDDMAPQDDVPPPSAPSQTAA